MIIQKDIRHTLLYLMGTCVFRAIAARQAQGAYWNKAEYYLWCNHLEQDVSQ